MFLTLACLSHAQNIVIDHGIDPPGQVDWQQIQANNFNKHFAPLYRALFACPAGNTFYDPKQDCHPKQGTLDYHEWKQACREAIRFFHIKPAKKACE